MINESETPNAELYGFVNPMFKIDAMLTAVLESMQLRDIEILLYDTTDDMGGYLGKFPRPTHEVYEQIKLNSIAQNTIGYKMVKKRTVTVASRKWTIICGVKEEHIDSQRSNLPYIIVATSLLISCFYNVIRVVLRKCLHKTQMKRLSSMDRTSLHKVNSVEFDHLGRLSENDVPAVR